jgi:hypothetical protein
VQLTECMCAGTAGYIEYLDKAGIATDSVDLIISNCVINLSPDKGRVLREVRGRFTLDPEPSGALNAQTSTLWRASCVASLHATSS